MPGGLPYCFFDYRPGAAAQGAHDIAQLRGKGLAINTSRHRAIYPPVTTNRKQWVAKLHQIVWDLKAQDISVIYVTHRLIEVKPIFGAFAPMKHRNRIRVSPIKYIWILVKVYS